MIAVVVGYSVVKVILEFVNGQQDASKVRKA
jgi:hypothetical protein